MKHRPAGTANGAEQEFRVFVQEIAAPLHRVAFLLCGDWYLADDLVQETLATTYSHWRKVQGAENPSAYVRRILINEARRPGVPARCRTGVPELHPALIQPSSCALLGHALLALAVRAVRGCGLGAARCRRSCVPCALKRG
jgi:Sigma-70 region 2